MAKQDNIVEIGLVRYPDCMISAVYGLADLFRMANFMASRHEGLQRPMIRVSQWLQSADEAEMICVEDTHPGLPNNPTMLIVAPSIVEPKKIPVENVMCQWLVGHHQQGVMVSSVCAGAFVLASAGLLKERRVTTHWMFAESLAVQFPDVTVDADRMMIDDGDIITAGGVMAWTDLGLRLVQRVMGPSIMLETARFLLVDPSGREQSFYSNFSPKLHHGDQQILKVQHWLQSNGARNVSVSMMATQAGMEERTFLRRFQKATGIRPTEYSQSVRIGKAREMLEFTKQNIAQIAWATGYEDPGAFRKVFQKMMGLTPGEYRTRFSMTKAA